MPLRHPRLTADLALLAMVGVWAFTFAIVKDATDRWGKHVMCFVAVRFWIATLAFLPLFWLLPKRATKTGSGRSGVFAGLAMLGGYGCQTAGLAHTTPATAGFITGLSVVLVPLGARALGRPVTWAALLGITIATPGLALLSIAPGSSLHMGFGEQLVALCAVAFAAQILITDRVANVVDPIRFTATQCAVTAAGATAYGLAIEVPASGWPQLDGTIWFAASFCGVLASTLAFLVQSVAQRHTPATHVALIYALEPVFAAAVAHWLRGEVITPRMQLGCALILAGMLCAELGPHLRKPRR